MDKTTTEDTGAFFQTLRKRMKRSTDDDLFIAKSGFDYNDPDQVEAEEGRLEKERAEAQ